MHKIRITLATHDGVNSWYCGVGTISQNFIKSIQYIQNKLGYNLEFNVLTPRTTSKCLGYRVGCEDAVRDICKSTGGTINYHSDASRGATQFGSHENWKASSIGAASILLNQPSDALNIVYFFDTSYARASKLLLNQLDEAKEKPLVIWVPHSTGKIHETANVHVDETRYLWEREAVEFTDTHPHAFLGAINEYMRQHLIDVFGAKPENIINLKNGVLPEPAILSHKKIEEILRKHHIDPAVPLILASGRAEKYKGLDTLIEGFARSKAYESAQLVLFTSSLTNYSPSIQEVHEAFTRHNIKGKLIDRFVPQEDLRALTQHHNTRAIAVPSHGEPFGMAPIEHWSWSTDIGPPIIASNVGGLVEQIEDGVNGFLVDMHNLDALGQLIDRAMNMSIDERKRFTLNGKTTVQEKYMYPDNIIQSIEVLTNGK